MKGLTNSQKRRRAKLKPFKIKRIYGGYFTLYFKNKISDFHKIMHVLTCNNEQFCIIAINHKEKTMGITSFKYELLRTGRTFYNLGEPIR